MDTIHRMLTNICSDDLQKSRYFYTTLLNLKVTYDSDWFVHLSAKDQTLELGLIDRTNPIVPDSFQNHPKGFYITFVVTDADAVYKIAVSEKFDIVNAPEDTPYGQRRLLLKDPDGSLIDISSPIKDFKF